MIFALRVKFWCYLSKAAIHVENVSKRISTYCLKKGLDVIQTNDTATELMADNIIEAANNGNEFFKEVIDIAKGKSS